MLNIKHTSFCPCNTTTLPDGMFSISICIFILEREMCLDGAVSLSDFFSSYKAYPFIVIRMFNQMPPAVNVAYLNTLKRTALASNCVKK